MTRIWSVLSKTIKLFWSISKINGLFNPSKSIYSTKMYLKNLINTINSFSKFQFTIFEISCSYNSGKLWFLSKFEPEHSHASFDDLFDLFYVRVFFFSADRSKVVPQNVGNLKKFEGNLKKFSF